MTQSGETKNNADLQKAFAELKDSLRHAVDPANDQAPKLGGAVLDTPPATVRPAAPGISSGPRAQTRDTHGSEGKIAATAEAGRRRKLLYLSAAVVISGLTALGWTLTRGHGTNDPEIEAAATPTTDVVDTSAASSGDANAATPSETATTESEAPAAETARAEPAPIQSPEPENAATPAPAATTEAAAAAQPQPAESPQGGQTEAAPAQSLTQPAALTPSAATAAAPKAAPAKQAALSPATATPETEAAKPAVAKPKPARPKAAAKPKPATQAARRPATETAPAAPPPAPVAAEAPPPPPAQSDGAFGFMKRTVNSVGSTLTNIGRGAMGN